MGRPHRAALGGYVYHVLNRANARLTIFDDQADYEAFENVLLQAVERTKTRLLAYCVMLDFLALFVELGAIRNSLSVGQLACRHFAVD